MVNNALMMWCRPNQGARQRDVAPKRPNSVNNDSQPSLQSALLMLLISHYDVGLLKVLVKFS